MDEIDTSLNTHNIEPKPLLLKSFLDVKVLLIEKKKKIKVDEFQLAFDLLGDM